MSTRRLPVTYDPQNFKLYAPREISGFSEITDIPTLRSEVGKTIHAVSIDDQGDYIKINNTDTVVTLENTGFYEGAQVVFIAGESNQICLAGTGNIKIHCAHVNPNTNAALVWYTSFPYASFKLTYLGSDNWLLEGDVSSFTGKTYTVTASGMNYLFTGESLTDAINPALTLRTHQLLYITNNTGTAHPLWIKTSSTIGAGNESPGWARIKNNGAKGSTSDTNLLAVSFNQAGTYHYICEYHSAMKNTITVTD